MLRWLASTFLSRKANAPAVGITEAMERALALVADGALQEAETGLHEALRNRPSARAFRTLGALCARQQRYDEAIDALYKASHLDPENAAAANLIGVCHTLMERFEQAAPYYDLALRLDPSVTDVYLNAAWNACFRGSPDMNRLLRDWLMQMRAGRAAAAEVPVRERLTLDRVTLCCIDCAYHTLAGDALRRTIASCDFKHALFLSDRDCDVEGVRFVKIDPIGSAAQYSNFVFRRLHEYIATDYVLIIQYDGFVLNPGAWDSEFLEYDYIGAPARVGGGWIVGNGGFSLRSRKLLHATRTDAEISEYDASRGPVHEDIAISKVYRAALETRHGVRFAPVDIAHRFAAEHSAPTKSSFGFHGLLHWVALYGRAFELPDTSDEGVVAITFRAGTELGALDVHRVLEARSVESAWGPP